MTAIHANVLTEDGLLLRECEHGVRHPVGRVAGRFSEMEVYGDPREPEKQIGQRHELRIGVGYGPCKCDGCCHDYSRHEFQQ